VPEVIGAESTGAESTSAGATSAGATGSGGTEPAPGKPARTRRRVTTKPVPGVDPNPPSEPKRHAEGENDERLKVDKPPHWG
jgi:hypothetical protein